MGKNQNTWRVCPICYSHFSAVKVLKFEALTLRLELCVLCGAYHRQSLRHDTLIVSSESTVQTVKFRRPLSARTDNH